MESKAESVCIIHRQVMASAEAMLFGNDSGPVPVWGLSCLSMLIEAVCLYDHLRIYDPHPFRGPRLNPLNPHFAKQDWIRIHDLYPTYAAQVEALESLRESPLLETGRIIGAEFLDCP